LHTNIILEFSYTKYTARSELLDNMLFSFSLVFILRSPNKSFTCPIMLTMECYNWHGACMHMWEENTVSKQLTHNNNINDAF